jgi:cyclophilin family peptidyl-prolyl cis-trans isomerase/HEAT repeat protein
LLVGGCPSHGPVAPKAPDDAPLRIRIAQAEVKRAGGVAELLTLAADKDVHTRELALRGLGRSGDPKAYAALEQALTDPEPRVVASAAAAIGVAASLDDKPLSSAALVTALATTKDPRTRTAIIEAIGRAGEEPAQDELVKAPELADVALALGRFGRRKIKLHDPSRAFLIAASAHADPRVRYAATYALGREFEPGENQDELNALVARIADNEAEVRAQAIAALARRKAIASRDASGSGGAGSANGSGGAAGATGSGGGASEAARTKIEAALRDGDWRVAVEAVRALAGVSGDDEGRTKVVESLGPRLAGLGADDTGNGQVVVEAMRLLLEHPIATQLQEPANAATAIELQSQRWVACLRAAAEQQGASGWKTTSGAQTAPGTQSGGGAKSGSAPAPGTQSGGGAKSGGAPAAGTQAAGPQAITGAQTAEAIAQCPLQDHLKLPLMAELFDDKRSDAGYRRAALRFMLGHEDPRVRAAGIGALPKTWKDGDEHAQATIVGTVISALAVKNPIVAGTAVDAAEQLYDAMGDGHPLEATLDAALVQRATTESDVELVQSLYALIGKKKIATGAEACRMGLDLPPAAAKAASECLTALGEPKEATPRDVPPPPVDPASVIGKRVLWHLKTTRGAIDIELRPDVAPWAVATIVSLTQRGYYDKKEFHRVVPNFVVQGGDPTESGWGGPGFTLPAEPGSVLDGPGYVEGGVGMADAGRDTAGSQWFIMHSRAPHLDGRYTWVGSVVSGQKSADALQIGDRVESATVELSPLSR